MLSLEISVVYISGGFLQNQTKNTFTRVKKDKSFKENPVTSVFDY